MKKLLALPVLVLLMLSCGPSKKQVIEFNDNMVNAVSKCSKAEKSFFEICSTYNPTAIHASLKSFAGSCKEAQAELLANKPHEDLVKLKEAALNLVNAYVNLEKDYAEYARLYSIPTADYTVEDEKQTSATAAKINDTINAGFDAFKAAQQKFSEKYDYKLVK